MWDNLSIQIKLNILAWETTVMVPLLAESQELVQMILSGASKESCLVWINENF